MLPQSPSYRLEPKTGVLGAALTQARNRLFQRWQRVYPTDASQQTLFRLPLALRQPEQVPYIAPHFIEQLRLQTQQLVQRDTRVDTTLDAGLQRLVERQVNAFIARNRSRGIQNAAVLLVDSRDMGGACAGGIGGLLQSADPGAGKRYQRQALAGFDAEAVYLRAGHGAGRAASDDHPERRAFVVRRLCAGKF